MSAYVPERLKILFICGSLDEGRNGVGDYTRLLAAELIRNGHGCRIIATHDKELGLVTQQVQSNGGTDVQVLRIPAVCNQSTRTAEASTWVETFDPDWVSVQFVTFSFDSRGLCFGFGAWIRQLASTRPVHIMFHELWPFEPNGSLVNVAVYALQKWIVRTLPRRSRARLITTQLPKSQERLRPASAELLPLFGNIPFYRDCGQDRTLDHDNALVGIIFGSAPSPEEFGNVLSKLDEIAESTGGVIILKLLGRNGRHRKDIIAMAEAKYGDARVKICGPMSSAELSCAFSTADFGIAKNTVDKIGKSGSAVGMLEHGLPVIVNGSANQAGYLPSRFQRLLVPTEGDKVSLPAKTDFQSMLPDVAVQFTELLQAFRQ